MLFSFIFYGSLYLNFFPQEKDFLCALEFVQFDSFNNGLARVSKWIAGVDI